MAPISVSSRLPNTGEFRTAMCETLDKTSLGYATHPGEMPQTKGGAEPTQALFGLGRGLSTPTPPPPHPPIPNLPGGEKCLISISRMGEPSINAINNPARISGGYCLSCYSPPTKLKPNELVSVSCTASNAIGHIALRGWLEIPMMQLTSQWVTPPFRVPIFRPNTGSNDRGIPTTRLIKNTDMRKQDQLTPRDWCG